MDNTEDTKKNKNESFFDRAFKRAIYSFGVGGVLFASALVNNNMEIPSPFSEKFSTEPVYRYLDLEHSINKIAKYEDDIIGRDVFLRYPSEKVKPLVEDLFGKRRQKLDQLVKQLKEEFDRMKQNPEIQNYNEWRGKKNRYSNYAMLIGSLIAGIPSWILINKIVKKEEPSTK